MLTFITLCIFFAESQLVSRDSMTTVHVVLCIDHNLGGQSAVMLGSMFENGNPTTFYHIHVQVPDGFNVSVKRGLSLLKKRYKNCMIDFINMGDRFQSMSGGVFPPCAFYVLQAASIFPEVKKMLYLDGGDIIIRHDLSQLYNTNIDNYYFAGIREVFELTLKDPKIRKEVAESKEMPDFKQYANGGVILWNLEKIRADKIEDKFLGFLESHRESVIDPWKGFWGAQDVINPVCYGKILLLPVKFNLMVNLIGGLNYKGEGEYEESEYARSFSTPKDWKEAIEDPVIVHFASKPKPWVDFNRTKYHQEFWIYANRNTFCGLKIKKAWVMEENNEKTWVKKENRKYYFMGGVVLFVVSVVMFVLLSGRWKRVKILKVGEI